MVSDAGLSYVEHKKTGKLIYLKRERGVFVIDAYLEKNPETNKASVFSRPEP